MSDNRRGRSRSSGPEAQNVTEIPDVGTDVEVEAMAMAPILTPEA